MKIGLFGLIFTLSIFFLSACQNNQFTTAEESAEKIRISFNKNDSEQLISITQSPLFIRHQEWESADDGSGFILGKYSDMNLTSDEEIQFRLKTLVDKINIQGKHPIIEGIHLDDFKENLTKSEHIWDNLDIALYLRGMADVEHIVIVGLDKNTHHLRAIYYN